MQTTPQSTPQVPPELDQVGSEQHAPLRLHDVRKVFRLINEIRELGDDPEVWRPHLIRRLRRLTEAAVVVSSEVHVRRVPADVGGSLAAGTHRVVDVGWVIDPHGGVSRVRSERIAPPETFWLVAGGKGPVAEAPAGPGGVGPAGVGPAGVAGQPTALPEGERVPVKPGRKVYGGTAFILSQVSLPHTGAVDQLGLHREWGDRPFTPADHRLARLFHVELARLWRRDVLRLAGEPDSDMPPRMAETLEALRAGASEREIAESLEVSTHTVHNYVKALHRRYRVSNRSQLLAKVPPLRPGASSPRLTFLTRPPARPGRRRK